MRATLWSRVLVVLSFFSLSVQASASESQEPGTRVLVRLTEANGQLPDTEKMVQSLVTVGGRHEVRVKRRHAEGQQELTVDLWGGTVPQADISQALRDAFPVLAAADIQVSTLDPQDRPDIRERVKKVVKIIKKE
ncbi:hypothetical protein [Hyalangium sp.]|uniref:hypothetical protein n=1 Tax=Hyalangium sp. TaxID=2028555 RepID=UPI002D2F86A7|nr:hypothetical protein [Hyalangium sp.]HYI02883.1 hypothetical protein [Hyalangium sp.]